MEMNSKRLFLSLKMEIVFCCSLPPIKREIACVAWPFWLGAPSNCKAGEGRETAKRLGRQQLENYFSPLVHPARQNRHATQAKREREFYAVVVKQR